jgi:hypothetical protein
MSFSKMNLDVRPVLVDGRVGFASHTRDGEPFSIVALTIEKTQSGRAQA